MVHNRECPKCGTIGNWNWAKERKEKMLPNGKLAMVRVIVEGEAGVKCPECGHYFEPHSHARLRSALKRVMS